MSLSMYQASIPAFIQMLNNFSAILDKAEAHARNRQIEPEVLLNYRLAPDMLPFVRQIQIAAHLAKGAAARLAGVEVPKHDDTIQACQPTRDGCAGLEVLFSALRSAHGSHRRG